MDTREPDPLTQDDDLLDHLDLLDQMATHVIDARALLMTLTPDERGGLQVLFDVLLVGIGGQIAAKLPPSWR